MQLPSIAITGGLGSIGFKSLLYLAEHSDSPSLYGLDYREANSEQQAQLEAAAARRPGEKPAVKLLAADLTDWADDRWRSVFSEVEAVIHLAASNTNPHCTWDQANESLAMTVNTTRAAAESPSLSRYIFASSNHVMDGYLHTHELKSMAPGGLTAEIPPRPGGELYIASKKEITMPYSSSKLAGELITRTLAQVTARRVTAVCLRIGAMRRERNIPELEEQVQQEWNQKAPPRSEEEAYERIWMRQMRISDRDWYQLLNKAVTADGSRWPGGVSIVNGVSANSGMKWSLEDGRRDLGYHPVDNFMPPPAP